MRLTTVVSTADFQIPPTRMCLTTNDQGRMECVGSNGQIRVPNHNMCDTFRTAKEILWNPSIINNIGYYNFTSHNLRTIISPSDERMCECFLRSDSLRGIKSEALVQQIDESCQGLGLIVL